MDADYVERLNRAAIKESAKNAREKKVASESGGADSTKKRGRPEVSGKVGNKKAKKNESTSNKRKVSESRSKDSQKSKKNNVIYFIFFRSIYYKAFRFSGCPYYSFISLTILIEGCRRRKFGGYFWGTR
jgi:hypothetical protein